MRSRTAVSMTIPEHSTTCPCRGSDEMCPCQNDPQTDQQRIARWHAWADELEKRRQRLLFLIEEART